MDCSMPDSLAFIISQSLLKLMSTESVMLSNHLILLSPSPPAFNVSLHPGLFKWVSSSHQLAKILEFQLQHQSFQWIFRTDFLLVGLIGSPCSPRDSQESSLTPEFKSRDITLPTKVHLVKAMVFPVVMYGCESWPIKKAEHWRMDTFELWC